MFKIFILVSLFFCSSVVAKTEKPTLNEDLLSLNLCIKLENECSRDCDLIKDEKIALVCMDKCEAQYEKCVNNLTKDSTK